MVMYLGTHDNTDYVDMLSTVSVLGPRNLGYGGDAQHRSPCYPKDPHSYSTSTHYGAMRHGHDYVDDSINSIGPSLHQLLQQQSQRQQLPQLPQLQQSLPQLQQQLPQQQQPPQQQPYQAGIFINRQMSHSASAYNGVYGYGAPSSCVTSASASPCQPLATHHTPKYILTKQQPRPLAAAPPLLGPYTGVVSSLSSGDNNNAYACGANGRDAYDGVFGGLPQPCLAATLAGSVVAAAADSVPSPAPLPLSCSSSPPASDPCPGPCPGPLLPAPTHSQPNNHALPSLSHRVCLAPAQPQPCQSNIQPFYVSSSSQVADPIPASASASVSAPASVSVPVSARYVSSVPQTAAEPSMGPGNDYPCQYPAVHGHGHAHGHGHGHASVPQAGTANPSLTLTNQDTTPSSVLAGPTGHTKRALYENVANIATLFWFADHHLLKAAGFTAGPVPVPARTPGSANDVGSAGPATGPAMSPAMSPAVSPAKAYRASKPFVDFVQLLVSKTQLPLTAVMLALLYILRLRLCSPAMVASQRSEYRVFTVALMLANKYLDDNTYTNKTWSDISRLPLRELASMEIEFLAGLDYSLHVTPAQWQAWVAGGLAYWLRYMQLCRRSWVDSAADATGMPSFGYRSWLSGPTSAGRSSAGRSSAGMPTAMSTAMSTAMPTAMPTAMSTARSAPALSYTPSYTPTSTPTPTMACTPSLATPHKLALPSPPATPRSNKRSNKRSARAAGAPVPASKKRRI